MTEQERYELEQRIFAVKFTQWRPVLRNIRHAIAIVSKDGYFVWANDYWQNLLGFTETELYHLKWQDLTPDFDEKGADEKQVSRVVQGEIESYVILKTYITKAKTFVDVELQVQKIVTEGGEFLAFVSAAEMQGTVHTSFIKKDASGAPRLDLVATIKAEAKARPVLSIVIVLGLLQWLAKQGVDLLDLVQYLL